MSRNRSPLRIVLVVIMAILAVQVLVLGALSAGLLFTAGTVGPFVVKAAFLVLAFTIVRRMATGGHRRGRLAYCGGHPGGGDVAGRASYHTAGRVRPMSAQEAEWEEHLAQARQEVDEIDATP